MCPSHFLLELSQLWSLALSWASLLALCCPPLPPGHHICPFMVSCSQTHRKWDSLPQDQGLWVTGRPWEVSEQLL